MLFVADPLPDLGVTTTAGGTATDPALLVLTLTLPDGSTRVGTWPAAGTDTITITRGSAGVFAAAYVTAAAGRHTARWVSTGAGTDGAQADAWNVSPATTGIPIVSLRDVREQCRASSTSDDEQLRWYALVASNICEDHTMVWRRTTLTATKDGGGRFLRLRAPIASVTTVVESGVTLASSDWTVHAGRGWLYRGTSTSADRWAAGAANITVTYVAGPADGVIPDGILQGVRTLTQHLWDTHRGGPSSTRPAGADFTIDPRTGFAIPNRVLELWRASMPAVQVG